MNRLALVLAILLISSTAIAGKESLKTTYSSAEIKQQAITNVDELITKFSETNSIVLKKGADDVLFLINGKNEKLTTEAKNNAITNAKSIEVLSNGASIVVNVLS